MSGKKNILMVVLIAITIILVKFFVIYPLKKDNDRLEKNISELKRRNKIEAQIEDYIFDGINERSIRTIDEINVISKLGKNINIKEIKSNKDNYGQLFTVKFIADEDGFGKFISSLASMEYNFFVKKVLYENKGEAYGQKKCVNSEFEVELYIK
ncbi:hypothetical protein [Peptostreptococcus sp. D1]|uniref:hypothetical protein n=1 Tax=Peptostreptococcus sp. D1 TaxID=72304 RepID=UPI0008F0EC6F|nr:hypothetical protein [Peptostreptococcus sp. D1]SFE26534.1 hypothetical protein SAMN02910278_00469 [Peptostreptococcus sp. D1]